MKKKMRLLIVFLIVVVLLCNPAVAENDGKIISIHIEPDLLVSGQSASHEITVKNVGTNSLDYQLEIFRSSSASPIYMKEFSLGVGETKTLTSTSTMGDPGPRTYTYNLEIDWTWPSSNELLDKVVEMRRCFSLEEVSDNDHDNLLYYVEVEEFGTNPDNPDTDGDGIRDDVDERPTIAEGSISIISNPSGASVYLDGAYMGETPLSLDNVISKSYAILVKKSGYNSKTLSLSLSAGGAENLDVLLESLSGSISVSSNPSGANIYLDVTSKGTTPKTISNVPIGSHTIKLTKPGYNDIYKTITVGSGEMVLVSETFTTKTGLIKIDSSPSGASVYFDDTNEGTTPITLNDIPVGSHTIKLTKSGYNDIYKTITVSSGKTTTVSESLSVSPIIIIISGFSLLLLLVFRVVIRNRKKPAVSSNDLIPPSPTKSAQSSVKQTTPLAATTTTIEKPKDKGAIDIKSAFQYNGATIQYKVKIMNHTTEPLSDIKIQLFVPEVFMLTEKEKSIPMLEPKESKTVTFDIRPTGECGDCIVSGRMNYYDYATKKRQDVDIEKKMVSIVCPVLKRKEIDEDGWRNATEELIKTEENTKDLDIPAENLFNIATRVLKDMSMYMIPPEITSTPQLFTGVGMFYAEGAAGMQYAAYIEVVGGRKSRMILKAWAEKEEALTGFYHRILDEIEKRLDIKIFIDEGIIQYHVHKTEIKDNIIQRSNIDLGTRAQCPDCGKEMEANEKFCLGCGAKF
ncbi:MAG: PEGA domain-containing protein [Methanosarcinales archaeon]|nr:PEGA domain-containing protein [Methanosarcinales archaeon]